MPDAAYSSRRWNPWLTGLLVAGICTALYLIDRDLARIEQTELSAEASTYFLQAERYMQEKDLATAIPLYERAVTLNRRSRQYQIALSRALVSDGNLEKAEPLLNGVLQADPNNGPANLEMARLLLARHDTTAATAYYHRAIYGMWPKGSEDRILRTRIELADILAQEQRKRELLSELLLLDEESQTKPELQERVARWYLQAGSPARAAESFRAIIDRGAGASADAYEGLGDAELARGNYRAADIAYTAALRKGHKSISKRLLTTVELVQLDPTMRRLSSAERLRRSELLLQRSLGLLTKCAPASDLQKRAEDALATASRKPGVESEDLLAITEDIWHYVGQACPNAASSDDTMTTLMTRLAEQP